MLNNAEVKTLLLLDEDKFYAYMVTFLAKAQKDNNNDDSEFIDSNQAMIFLKVSRSTLQTYRDSGELPFYKLGSKTIVYLRSELREFVSQFKVEKF